VQNQTTCVCSAYAFPVALFNLESDERLEGSEAPAPPFLTAVGIASLIAVGVVGVVGFALLFAARKTARTVPPLTAARPVQAFAAKAPPQVVQEENLADIEVAPASRQVVSMAAAWNPFYQQQDFDDDFF
jgi:hypothetical protein